MPEEKSGSGFQAKDLPPEEVEAAKRRTRINALIGGLIFMVSAFAPSPWNAYAPLLFVIPLGYSLSNWIRKSSRSSDASPSVTVQQDAGSPFPGNEPYSYTPSDPKDPRRYKPIG